MLGGMETCKETEKQQQFGQTQPKRQLSLTFEGKNNEPTYIKKLFVDNSRMKHSS